MSAFARTGRIFFLAAVCCSAAFADMHPSRSASVPEANSGGSPATTPLVLENKSGDFSVPPLGAFATDVLAHNKDVLPLGKPNNSSAMTVGEISAKWSELQTRIRADEAAVTACRLDQAACSQAARRFLSVVDLGRQREGRVRLGWINRAVNMAIRPTSDWVQYGYADFWASPLQTLGSGAGDCEDYAIVKYVALRELGVLPDDLRLVIVQDEKREIGHAVVAVRHEQRWLILDNRTMAILDADEVRDYRPLFALDQQGTRAIATAAIERITSR
jgi:predicted transglutaminase-like cysteine proteinase